MKMWLSQVVDDMIEAVQFDDCRLGTLTTSIYNHVQGFLMTQLIWNIDARPPADSIPLSKQQPTCQLYP